MWIFGKKKEGIVKYIEQEAKKNPKRIVYPEPEDDRILKAAEIVSKKKSAQITLLGNPIAIQSRAKELRLDLSKVNIIDFENSDKAKDYASKLYELRREKGMTSEEAEKLMLNSRYFATMMVKTGDADGMVSGAAHNTADTLRPALQIIKTKEGAKYASSFFIMAKDESVYFFADCAFIQDPNVDELTSIAIETAASAKRFGYEPRVAMLSFSTKGSAEGPILEKVRKATEAVKKQMPELIIDGEMQLDAAIVPEVAKKKCPDSQVAGNANVLVFPDLNSGNIGYKLVERFGHTHAIGPIVQGLRKPVNDLSRGCSVEDIVLTTEVTVMEAQTTESVQTQAESVAENPANLPIVAPTTALVPVEEAPSMPSAPKMPAKSGNSKTSSKKAGKAKAKKGKATPVVKAQKKSPKTVKATKAKSAKTKGKAKK